MTGGASLGDRRAELLTLFRARATEKTAPFERELPRLLEGLSRPGTEWIQGCGQHLARAQPLAVVFSALSLLDRLLPAVLDGPGLARALESLDALRVAVAETVQLHEQQLVESAVRSEERYLAAARAAGFAIWDWDLSGEHLHWSANAGDILGSPVSELSNIERWLEHVHPADRERVAQGLRQAIAEGKSRWVDSFLFLQPSGGVAGVLARAWIHLDALGRASRVVGGLIDITAQRQLEQQLEARIAQLGNAQAALHDAVRARDEFLSIASHELRTPLTALRLQVNGLTRGPNAERLETSMRSRLEAVDACVERLVHLVDELLDVSKITSGPLEVRLEDVDFCEVVRSVVAALQPSILRSGSALNVKLPETLTGRWDPARLSQIINNLVTNALKYGQRKPIFVSAEKSEGWVKLQVRDHGVGIAAADQARIFERFERAVSIRHFGGFGLGLWIAQQAAEAMGGNIAVESTPGEGSTFTVTLPCGERR